MPSKLPKLANPEEETRLQPLRGSAKECLRSSQDLSSLARSKDPVYLLVWLLDTICSISSSSSLVKSSQLGY